ncbi:MAG: CHAD domain-containing protein [Phycisphaeraceae bacterium]|nr:CHAD domain-containing protein [Phycisphaeraceae bacterium]
MGKSSINRPEATSPLRPAARSILAARLRSVTRLVKDVNAGYIRKPEYIHQLRVAIRRAEAAINAFEPELRARAVARARRRLRAVRKAAGMVRDCDVHGTLLRSIEGLKGSEQKAVRKYLVRRLDLAREESAREVLAVARPKRMRAMKKARRKLVKLPRRVEGDAMSPPTLLGAALRAFTRVTAETRAAAGQDLTNLEHLHGLRVSAKQVRYAVEIFRVCLPGSLCDSTLTHLREFQAVLGRVNDLRQMSSWLASEAKSLNSAARPKLIPKGTTAEAVHEELLVIVGKLDADLAAAQEAALPLIAGKLEAALAPLEAWTREMGSPKTADEAAAELPRLAGRSAEGTVERPGRHEADRRGVGSAAAG